MAARVPEGSLGVGEAAPPPWKAQLMPPPLLCVVLLVVAWCAARVLEWAWLSPRRLGRALRSQGLRGTVYRPLAGDAPLADRLAREARSRAPLPPGCHAVVPRAMPLFHHAMEEHGKTSITWSGPVPRVTIADPELVRQVLSNKFGHFEKLGLGQLQRLLHNGVSAHKGDKWARHRRIINPAFHLDKLKRMLPAFASCCADLVNRWEGLVAGGAGDGEPCEVDVWPEMQRLTGDVISRAAFGSSYLEGRRIFQLQEEQVKLAMLIANKIHIPGYIMLPTRINRRMKRIAAEIEGILGGMIAKREDALRSGEATGDDLLGLLLDSNMEQSRGDGGEGRETSSGGGMSADDVIGECKLFYFAGMETTSVLLTWTMLVLCMHPEWQDRAREEVLRVFGGAGTTPDYDGLSRLKIVTMVLYEVLRLYTPLPAVHRRTYKPMELGGVRYPAGVTLVLPLLCIHHDKGVWGADADEFRPERFAEGVARASGDHQPAAFFPFGGGPRTCVGQSFALLEAKMGIAMILRSFALELSPSYSHAPFPAPLLRPEHGAQIKLTTVP
ncbi:Cytochrome P450 72A14 [Dichanthelium oligosanthes]|uniref:Cytochrome P450 72A14 n=1 Tax=Dichanthelium oligosanthes TaxID=888268 RepID=A0A1E5VZC9_9POAL|nr:Cytochrome P450 72A14 [Dichanthelium oligosanthes]